MNNSGIVDVTFSTGGLSQDGLQINRQRVSLENPLRPSKEIITWQYARELRNQFRKSMKMFSGQNSTRINENYADRLLNWPQCCINNMSKNS